MSVSSQPEIELTVTPNAGVEVKKFMDAEGVTAEQGGLRKTFVVVVEGVDSPSELGRHPDAIARAREAGAGILGSGR